MKKLNLLRWMMIVTVAVMMTACGDESTGGDNNDTNATVQDTQSPVVVSMSPSDNDINISRSVSITATFDESMKSSTITPSSFTLIPAGAPAVNATVAYDDTSQKATLSPVDKLSMLTTYTANVTASAKDLAGNALIEKRWSFTTCDGNWGTASIISDDESTTEPHIVFDKNGDAFAVWNQYGHVGRSVYFSRYSVSADTWSGSTDIDAGAGNADSSQIAIDPNGDVVVVWKQDDGTHYRIYVKRYTPSTNTWSGSVAIDAGTGDADSPHVAIGTNGDAIVVWREYDGANHHNYANRYIATTNTWSGAVGIDAGSDWIFPPNIAIGIDGKAFAIWSEGDSTHPFSVYVNRYSPSTNSWSGATQIDTSAQSALQAQIATDKNGNAIAVWTQENGAHYSVFTRRYTASTGAWGSVEDIGVNLDIVSNPQIVLDNDNNAIVVWTQNDVTADSIYASRYSFSLGHWSGAVRLEASDGVAREPQIAIDNDGNAIAIWVQDEGTNKNVYANRYIATKHAWEGRTIIGSDSTDKNDPQIAISQKGNAMAAWFMWDDPHGGVYINRFE